MITPTPNRFNVPLATPQNPHCTELVVRKSKFLASGCRCCQRKDALEFVALIRQKYPDATHNCWAYAASVPGSTQSIGSSDDGEPHGTAGRPILQGLLHGGIGQVCMVVSRWFGGIKLGTGGLSRAYLKACAENLATMPITPSIAFSKWQVEIPYSLYEQASNSFASLEAKITDPMFADKVSALALVPEDRLRDFLETAKQIGNGQIVLTPVAD